MANDDNDMSAEAAFAAVREALRAAGLEAAAPIRLTDYGRSGDIVAQVRGREALYVKIAPAWRAYALAAEGAALTWIAGRARAPELVWRGALKTGAALITRALPGAPLSHVEPAAAAEGLARGLEALAALHMLDPSTCPFDQRLPVRLARARAHVEAGLVDEADFDDARRGRSAAALLAEAEQTAPPGEDIVVTHGDASLPNLILGPAGVGFVDLGRFGLADRHQDLAIFLRSARRNHPDVDCVALLRRHYPLAPLDEGACAYYLLLDEFF